MDSSDPPQGLEEKILRRIEILEASRLKRTFLITRVGRVGSLVALASAGFFFGHSVIASDFWQLVALLFSDGSIIANYFSEFFLSLLETMPALPIAIILAPLFSFLFFQFWSQNIGGAPKYTPATAHA